MTPEERERRIREIAERLAERLDTEWREGNLTVNEIEELAERVGQDVQREITERFLREEARAALESPVPRGRSSLSTFQSGTASPGWRKALSTIVRFHHW